MLMQENLLSSSGIEVEELISHEFSVSRVWIKSKQAAEKLDKPCGLYITINTGPLDETVDFENACACFVEQLQPILAPFYGKPLCICGIGSKEFEFDALGPETVDRVRPKMYEVFTRRSNFEKIATICPGVNGKTNLLSESIIYSVAATMNAACILTIDSCHCDDLERLCSVIQLTNTGMKGYLGTVNLCRSTLGVPVISIAVPTAIRANSISRTNDCSTNLFLTPTYVSEAINTAAFIISCAIAQIAYPDLNYESCKQCIGLFLTGIA